MATTTLGLAYLADVNNQAAGLTFGTAPKTDTRSITGEVREMANGVLRAVGTPADRRTIDITAVYVTETMREQFKDWRGRVVMYRDTQGRIMFGVYWSVKTRDYRDGNFDVSFTLERVTYDQNVPGSAVVT